MTIGDPKEYRDDLTCAEDMQVHATHGAGSAAGVVYEVATEGGDMLEVLSDQGSGSWFWSYLALDWLTNSPFMVYQVRYSSHADQNGHHCCRPHRSLSFLRGHRQPGV